MEQVNLAILREKAEAAKDALWRLAYGMGRQPMIYLHWSAGRYEPNAVDLADYHVLILQDGSIRARDLTAILEHTWRRNTAGVAVALAACYDATTEALGDYPPTAAQIETMAQIIAVLCQATEIPLDAAHVMTHAEAADLDGYGPATTCERWDLWFLANGDAPGTGGDTLRDKAIWYQQNGVGV